MADEITSTTYSAGDVVSSASTNYVHWANYDIMRYGTDAVYLTASEPVDTDYYPEYMYLYNDVRLPAAPAYDTEVYPYATIFLVGDTVYYRYATAEPYSYISASDQLHIPLNTAFKSFTVDGRFWVCYNSNANTAIEYASPTEYVPIWTNYDLMSDDDTAYMTATNAVPNQDWELGEF